MLGEEQAGGDVAEDEAGKNQGDSGSDASPSVLEHEKVAAVNQIDREEDDRERPKKKKPLEGFEKVSVRIQLVSLFALMFYTVASILMWLAMRDSNELTDRSIVEAERSADAAILAVKESRRQFDLLRRDSAIAAFDERKRFEEALAQQRVNALAEQSLTKEGLAELRRQQEIAARNLKLAQQSEAPAFSVASSAVTIDGLRLTMRIVIKNSGRGVARITQLRWNVGGEGAAWSIPADYRVPDSTTLGPGDTRYTTQILVWDNENGMKKGIASGIRYYIFIDYVNSAGESLTDYVCQSYDSTGAHDCMNKRPP